MPTYRFGPFTYHPQTGALRSSKSQQLLRQQVNRLLLLLIKNRERVLTREDILAEIWPGEYVEPNNFFQCVNHLRKALGEQADAPQFFRNFRGKGYQWICQVEEMRASPLRRFTEPVQLKIWLAAAIGVCAMLGIGWLVAAPLSSSRSSAPGTTQRETEARVLVSASNHDRHWRSVSAANRSGAPLPLAALSLMDQMKNHRMKVFARIRTAYLLGELPHCETLLTMAGVRARELGDSEAEAMAELVLARIGRYRDPASAKTKALRVKRISVDLGNDFLYFEACYSLVFIHLDLGETDLAYHQLREPRFLAAMKTDRQHALAKLAEGVLTLGDNHMARAETILMELKSFPSTKMRDTAPKIRLFEAALLFAQARYDQAATKVNSARGLFLEGRKQPLLEMRSLWLSCQIETLRGNAVEANRLRARTAEIADRYGFHFFKGNMKGLVTGTSSDQHLKFGAENRGAKGLPTALDAPTPETFPKGFFNL